MTDDVRALSRWLQAWAPEPPTAPDGVVPLIERLMADVSVPMAPRSAHLVMAALRGPSGPEIAKELFDALSHF